MLEMPDAAPTCSAETAEVEAEEAGPLANASPTESTTSGPRNARYVQLDSTNVSTPKLMAESRKPSATSRAGPTLTANGVITGVTRIITAAAGSVARPASKAL